MAALTEEEKRAMIVETHETAWVMVEDMEYIREVVAKPDPIPRDIRHLSNVLRRLLIDNGGDFRKISSPRLGRRFHLTAPDIGALIKAGNKEPWTFLSAGVADVFGLSIDAWSVNPGNIARPIPGHNSDKTIQLPMDNFLNQKVVCFQGQWITRADTIKYIANVAHGVHAGVPKEPKHELIKKIRHIASIKMDTMPVINFDPNALAKDDKPIAIDRSALDFVLIQLMATARCLTLSPDVQELEAIVKNEKLT